MFYAVPSCLLGSAWHGHNGRRFQPIRLLGDFIFVYLRDDQPVNLGAPR